MTLKTEASYTDVLPVSKKKYYIASNCYAMFNFDLNLLPMKLNLPMVYPPLPWKSKVSVPLRLSDLEGGYLSGVNVDIINRFRLLTSRDYNHFYIKWNSPNGVCDVLNILQPITIYMLWRERNSRFHSHSFIPTQDLISSIVENVRLKLSTFRGIQDTSQNRILQLGWNLPDSIFSL